MLTKTLKLRLDEELLDELHERAALEEMPASLIVRRALRHYLRHTRPGAVLVPATSATKER